MLVTGGASGLGAAIARGATAAGYRVATIDVSAARGASPDPGPRAPLNVR
jgi:NAD(P)-dependent dehydrogenase (short-subunit alcohol dehydrogenase family)